MPKPLRVMIPYSLPLLASLSLCSAFATQVAAQTAPLAPPPKRIEPGLEEAISWSWRVVPPSDEGWGRLMAELKPAPAAPGPGAPVEVGAPGSLPSVAGTVELRPQQYTVEKGDAIIKIAKKFAMTGEQLKAVNGLDSDVIRVGQVLQIPTLEQLKSLAPPPPPKPVAETDPKKAKGGKPAPASGPKPLPVYGLQAQQEYVNVLLQVYLDREGFSSGYIDGKSGPVFQKTMELYLTSHEGASDAASLMEKARSVMGDPYTTYQLRPDDFRLIQPLKAVSAKAAPVVRRKPGAPAPADPDPTYNELIAAPVLLYRNVWEFVAERFHCDEGFLRRLNPKIKGNPVAGTSFRVPNVFAFEIEHALEEPLQPLADAAEPVTAAIVGLVRLEIYKSGKLVGVMPVASARPGLRGRNFWTVLDAIPAPRLATLQAPKDVPKVTASPVVVTSVGAASIPAPEPAPAPVAQPVLTTEQFLGSGPNNPVGIAWINLARGKGAEPLPFGLHGTSIPAKMNSQEGLGGFRLTNWDIARVVKMLPAGTQLEWREK